MRISKHSPFRLKITVGLCLCGVLRGVCVVCCVGVWWWCCVVWWCIFVSFCVVFLFFFPNFLLFLFFPLFLSSLFSCSYSSLFSYPPPNTMERTDQPTRRPTSRHLNVIWRRASAQQSVLSLLLSPPSLPSPPLLLKNKGGNFLLQEYFRRGNYFTLQFDSEKSPPGEITDITVLY